MGAADKHQTDCWIGAAVKRFESPLVRYTAHITGDIESARDVVQDAFLRLCRENPIKLGTRHNGQLPSQLAPWLYTVCRRRALDVRKKEQRMKTLTEKQAATQAAPGGDQQTAAEQNDEMDRVRQAMACLTSDQQEVLRLKFQSGLSYREISEITEHSIGNVGYLLHTALQKIRRRIGAQQ